MKEKEGSKDGSRDGFSQLVLFKATDRSSFLTFWWGLQLTFEERGEIFITSPNFPSFLPPHLFLGHFNNTSPHPFLSSHFISEPSAWTSSLFFLLSHNIHFPRFLPLIFSLFIFPFLSIFIIVSRSGEEPKYKLLEANPGSLRFFSLLPFPFPFVLSFFLGSLPFHALISTSLDWPEKEGAKRLQRKEEWRKGKQRRKKVKREREKNRVAQETEMMLEWKRLWREELGKKQKERSEMQTVFQEGHN